MPELRSGLGLSSIGTGDREFVFTAADFERVRKMIYEHAGISLAATKQDMVYSRLARRLRETGKRTFSEYLALLERGDRLEWEKFVNSLTTNLTSFFREPHHFPILADHLRKIQGKQSIKIWCSAASTGEEPYSIAITAVEALGGYNVPVTIVATDLDTSVLATAAKGVYPADRVDKMSPERLNRFFTREPLTAGGGYVVKPELRRMITFQRLNLLEPNWFVRGPIDALFCRNVMIYFDKPTQHKILTRFAPLMSENGLLFAGHSESFLHAADLFRSLGKTVYDLVPKKR
ncbi:CheR family methyltransferase [uncultured Propionivibrio sp.]|uniref:CheR family methyltransferase n=1 Tax=uncultured Propionivibrio sp. TaxID=426737 RepID=UPI0029C06A41|nr:CheR family methyltransferase [uncultured Propionivibrio sp.]